MLFRSIVACNKEINNLTLEVAELKDLLCQSQNDLKEAKENGDNVTKELQNSKLVLREAIISWRAETKALNQQLDQFRNLYRVHTTRSEHFKSEQSISQHGSCLTSSSHHIIGEDIDSEIRGSESQFQDNSDDINRDLEVTKMYEIDSVPDCTGIEISKIGRAHV